MGSGTLLFRLGRSPGARARRPYKFWSLRDVESRTDRLGAGRGGQWVPNREKSGSDCRSETLAPHKLAISPQSRSPAADQNHKSRERKSENHQLALGGFRDHSSICNRDCPSLRREIQIVPTGIRKTGDGKILE